MRTIAKNQLVRSSKLLKLCGTVTLIAVPLLLISMVSVSLSRVTHGQDSITSGLLLTVSATPLYADEPAAAPTSDTVTGLSAADAVALGVSEFVKQYTTKSTDATPAGIKKALDIFYQFQRDLNRTATLALPKTTQHLIGDLRGVYQSVVEANISEAEAQDQGGTLYATIRARAAANREVTLAKVIATLQTSWFVSNQGKRAFEPAFTELKNTISTLPTPDEQLPKVWLQRYKETHSTLLADMPKLHKILLLLPDNANAIVLTTLQLELAPLLEAIGTSGDRY